MRNWNSFVRFACTNQLQRFQFWFNSSMCFGLESLTPRQTVNHKCSAICRLEHHIQNVLVRSEGRRAQEQDGVQPGPQRWAPRQPFRSAVGPEEWQVTRLALTLQYARNLERCQTSTRLARKQKPGLSPASMRIGLHEQDARSCPYVSCTANDYWNRQSTKFIAAESDLPLAAAWTPRPRPLEW
jgi:hypothetical protein